MLHFAEEHAAAVPQPRSILLVEWDRERTAGGTIGFLSASQEIADEAAGQFGEVVANAIAEGVFASLYELRVSPLYGFEDVLSYLQRLAGPDGILTGW